MQRTSWAQRIVVGPLAVIAVAVAGLVAAAPAQADTAPVDPAEPTTVTADSLPTVQINGVVWNQQIVGNTVYVAGDFTKARPAGSAPGANEVNRTYLLAYDLTTGALIPSFAPVINAQVKDLALSPDGTRLYAVGNFTSIDGQTRYRIASFDTATRALTSFRPTVNAPLASVTATSAGVFFSGSLTSVQGTARVGVAGINPATSTVLPFNPTFSGGSVRAVVAAPDGASVVMGGSFTSVNGGAGYGLARVSTATGASIPLPVNTFIRNGGEDSAVLSLESDGTDFYGAGYHFGGGGNMEGSFSASWATGQMNWVEDCHGDTYSAFPAGDEVYSASHKHYCGNTGGFPQTNPWSYYRGTATSKAVFGVNTPDIYGYPDHDGEPAPRMLNWYPTINSGSFTGKDQGPWTVNGNDDYVLFGGEFTQVNGVAQQGLARFARSAIAPDLQGPRLSGANFPLAANSFVAGQVRLSWRTNYDRDNASLTYKIYRTNLTSAPIYTETVAAPFWLPKSMGFVDRGLAPGSSQRYRLEAVDAFGNLTRSDWITVTVSNEGAASAYADAVWEDEATSFWRLGESLGPDVYDWSGFSDATASSGVTRGVPGAIDGDPNTAARFSGTTSGLVATGSPVPGPQVFSIETWFRTTSMTGGKIVGFGNRNTGTSTSYDRHIYMLPSGKVVFGVYPGASRTVTSGASYNDGAWHQAVATLGPDGQKLYIDGKRVAQAANVTSAQAYSGYWRIGGDSPWEGDAFFRGDIDDVSIYGTPLTPVQVNAHWVAAGRSSTLPTAPADAYGAAVFNLHPDLYWRFNDATGSATAADSGQTENAGTYQGAVERQVDGAVPGANKAVRFPPTAGTHGLVVATRPTAGPATYSQELWFKTATTSGGKLIGLGDATSGTSSNYDRHVYMEVDGRLTFGVWTGEMNTISTPAAYNDNQWHHMVATQSSEGMRLYVDGELRGTHPQTGAQDYTGYWRIGGDTTWGPQPWFDGTIDEAAVYPIALTPAQVATHWQLGSGATPPNAPPAAAFTSTVTDQSVLVDGSSSTDSDGTVAGYAWNFGDGATATGATATHVYDTAGDHTVTLTVTDDDGATGQVSHVVTTTAPNVAPTAVFTATATGGQVTVDAGASTDSDGTITAYAWNFGDGGTATGPTATHTYASAGTKAITLTVTDDDGATGTTSRDVLVVIPNQAPTASFVATPGGLTVALDATASADPDGTLTAYAWDFGDGATGTGVTTSHPYAAAGDYTVTLTVTDDDGATAQTSRDVSVTTPPANAPFAVDGFARTVSNGWGVADVGGTWTSTGTASRFSVGGSAGRVSLAAGITTTSVLAGVSSASTDITTTVGADKVPGGGGAMLTVLGRRASSGEAYGARIKLLETGAVQLHLTRPGTTLVGGTVPGISYTAGARLNLRLQVTGASPTTVQAKVWKVGDPEPGAWFATFTDSATPALQGAGAIGVQTFLSGSAANGPVVFSYDDLSARPVGAPAPNQPPTAEFTPTVSGLGVSVDASASTDPDGAIASYAWQFGDGGTASGVTATHAYASAGTYPVTLTTTDGAGATATSTTSVTVEAPLPDAPFVTDAFARTIAGGWGTADTGGVWTVTGAASRFAVDGSVGTMTVPAGVTVETALNATASPSARIGVTIGADKRPDGGGSLITVQGRKVGAEAYGARLKLLADGSVQLHVTRGAGTVINGGTVAGLTFDGGNALRVSLEVVGSAPTTVRAKVWKVGEAEPDAWRASMVDSTASLQGPGTVGFTTYLAGSATVGPVVFSYDDLTAAPVG